MSEIESAVVGLLAGSLLGAAFFGGLLWTVRRALSSDAAGVWFACSYLVRFAAVGVSLYALAHDDVIRGMGAGLGLIASRLTVALLGGRGASGSEAMERAQ